MKMNHAHLRAHLIMLFHNYSASRQHLLPLIFYESAIINAVHYTYTSVSFFKFTTCVCFHWPSVIENIFFSFYSRKINKWTPLNWFKQIFQLKHYYISDGNLFFQKNCSTYIEKVSCVTTNARVKLYLKAWLSLA